MLPAQALSTDAKGELLLQRNARQRHYIYFPRFRFIFAFGSVFGNTADTDSINF